MNSTEVYNCLLILQLAFGQFYKHLHPLVKHQEWGSILAGLEE